MKIQVKNILMTILIHRKLVLQLQKIIKVIHKVKPVEGRAEKSVKVKIIIIEII